MEEKRRHVRVPLVVKVTNRRTNEFHFFYSRDISLGGIFLETRDPYPMDTEVELDFFLQIEERKERAIIMGKVSRVRAYEISAKDQPISGMGIKFENLAPETMAIIGNFIRLTLETND